MQSVSFLSHFLASHDLWAKMLLFFGVLIEGEIALIFAGVLLNLRALGIGETILIVSSAALLKTALGYSLGGFLVKRWPKSPFLKYVEKKILLLLPRFKERPFWSIFISKFIYGVNHVTMIFAGFMKANFRIYMKAEILSTIVWLLGFLAIGYFFSHTAIVISHDIKKFGILIILFITGFIFLQRLITFLYDLAEMRSRD